MAAGKPAKIQVDGARELRRALKHLDAGIDDLKDAHRDAGELIAEEGRTLAPYDTGELRGSIRPDRRANGSNVLAGGRRVPYAGPIHFGWPAHNIDPDPFLYDALDNRADEVRAAYAHNVEALVRRVDLEFP
jgi:hypothetical protein